MWKLIRKHDNLEKISENIGWIEWDINGAFKEKHDLPKIGYSLLMSPFTGNYTWLTTEIVDLISTSDNEIIFITKNSQYSLIKIND